jgi:Sec-independent protein translocase protein TatA
VNELITSLRIVITGNATGAVAAITEVTGATKGAAAAQEAWVAEGRMGLGLMAGGFGMVAVAAGLALDVYDKYAQTVVQIQRITGLTAVESSKLVGQFKALGVNGDTVGRVIARLSKNYEAAIGSMSMKGSPGGAMEAAFRNIGFSVAQLKAMNADTMLEKVRDRLSELPASAQKTADIIALFGRGAQSQDFLRWLAASKKQLDDINQRVKGMGLIFSQKDLDTANQFTAALLGAKLMVEAFAVNLGKTLAPEATKAFKVLDLGLSILDALPGPVKAILVFTPGVLLMAGGIAMVGNSLVTAMKSGVSFLHWVTDMISWLKRFKTTTQEQTASTNDLAYSQDAEIRKVETQLAIQKSQIPWINANTVATKEEAAATGQLTFAQNTDAVAMGRATIATQGETGALGRAAIAARGFGASLAALAGPAAIGVVVIGIYEIEKAWRQAQDAFKQYQDAVKGFNQTAAQNKNEVARWSTLPGYGKPGGPQSMAAINASNKQNAVNNPGISGYGLQFEERLQQAPVKWSTEAVSWISRNWGGGHAAGGSFMVNRPTLFGAGESGSERIDITPAGSSGSGSGTSGTSGGGDTHLHLHLEGALVIGAPSAQVGRQLAEITAPYLGEMFHTAAHGSKR